MTAPHSTTTGAASTPTTGAHKLPPIPAIAPTTPA